MSLDLGMSLATTEDRQAKKRGIVEYKNEMIVPKKILWAVDPFVDDKKVLSASVGLIQELLKTTPSTIEPIYLLSTYARVPFQLKDDLFHKIKTTAQDKLNVLLKSLKFKEVLPLTVIYEPFLMRRQGVDRLLEYAKGKHTDLIVLSTHARKGPSRWIMGSFAESLILESDIPLLTVNPQYKQKNYFKHILFPTDFSVESEEAFHRILSWAKLVRSDVTLFHKPISAFIPGFETGWITYPVYQQSIEDEKKRAQEEAAKWIAEAKHAGVKATLYLDSDHFIPVDVAILKYAKKRPGIIAMAAHSDSLSVALLGSITRQIVRDSPFPVWIVHPQEKERKMKEAKVTEIWA